MAAQVVSLASWNADLVCRVPRPVARGETMMASSFEIGPGGKGSNAAVACARQGVQVAVIARIGDDDFGRLALALWAREGIDTHHVEVVPGEPSGVAQIWVYDDGDNSIAVAPGAGLGLGTSHAGAAAADIRSARVVMAPCEVPLAATTAAFRTARAAGVTTVLNPAPAMPLPDALLALCDVLTPNQSELRALAGGATVPSEADCAQALLGRGARAVVVTLGAAGCALYRLDRPAWRLPGHGVNVADTIGAGDTFTGVLAAALARGEALESALVWANAAAALSVTGRGAITGMPTREAVAALLGGA